CSPSSSGTATRSAPTCRPGRCSPSCAAGCGCTAWWPWRSSTTCTSLWTTRPRCSTTPSPRSPGSLDWSTRLPVPHDRVGDVACLQAAHLVLGEFQLHGRERVLDVPGLGGSHDRGGHAGTVQQPGERDLGRRYAPLRGHLGDRIDHLEVGLAVEAVHQRVG